MPDFQYQARTAAGAPQSGREEAASASALTALLRARGWLVLAVVPAGAGAAAPVVGAGWRSARQIDVEMGLQQIAVMLRSGLTLLAALRTAAEQTPRPRMAWIWNDVADRIQQGESFADALAHHPRFPTLVVQLVRVGEQTGILDEVLVRGAEALERGRLLRTQLATVLFYPTFVVIMAVSVAAFMVFYLVPKLEVFLRAMGRKLPPVPQALVDVSQFLQGYIHLIGIGILALTAGLVAVYLWPPGRLFLDRLVLRLPVIGSLLRLAATARFAHAQSVLLRSGVTLVEGLRTVGGLFRNRYLAAVIAAGRNSVLGGGSLGKGLTAPGAFLPMLPRMATVGEASGALDDVLAEVARFHEMQLQGAIRRFSVIIEPIIILVVGGIVGFVYIAFFMALFSVAGSYRG